MTLCASPAACGVGCQEGRGRSRTEGVEDVTQNRGGGGRVGRGRKALEANKLTGGGRIERDRVEGTRSVVLGSR